MLLGGGCVAQICVTLDNCVVCQWVGIISDYVPSDYMPSDSQASCHAHTVPHTRIRVYTPMIDHDGDQGSQSASNANSCGPSGVVRLADLIRVARGVAVVGRHGGWDEKSASTIHTGIISMVRK